MNAAERAMDVWKKYEILKHSDEATRVPWNEYVGAVLSEVFIPALLQARREGVEDTLVRFNAILNEVDCRIEHGASSGGHLEYVRKVLKATIKESRLPTVEEMQLLFEAPTTPANTGTDCTKGA